MKQIVAIRIGTVITNIPSKIIAALDAGRTDIELLDRKRMQFMAACDLGPQWEALANGRTLFCLDDDGNLLSAEEIKLVQLEIP